MRDSMERVSMCKGKGWKHEGSVSLSMKLKGKCVCKY